MNQTGSVDGQKGTKHGVVYLNPSNTHVHSHIHTGLFIHSRYPNFSGNCCSSGNTKNPLSYLMTSAWREKNKGEAVLTANSRLSLGHTHTVSYTPANSLLCFNACQRRLKRTEEHNSEENKQADENMGSNREKKRKETKSKEICSCSQEDIRAEQMKNSLVDDGGIF